MMLTVSHVILQSLNYLCLAVLLLMIMLLMFLMLLENEESLKHFTLESILSGVHCFRCHDHTQLIAVARTLDSFLSQHPKVSWHFRHCFLYQYVPRQGTFLFLCFVFLSSFLDIQQTVSKHSNGVM